MEKGPVCLRSHIHALQRATRARGPAERWIFSSGRDHVCSPVRSFAAAAAAYVPLEYYETDLISQARCRLRYGSFVLFILV